MPRITECHSDIPQIHRLLIGDRRKVFQCRKDICLCVERRDRFLAAPCILAVQHLRVALLDMRRVRQHDAHEVTSGACGVNVTRKALAHETRNPPTVIDVRVGQKDRIDLSGVEREWLIVHLAQSTRALIHTAVHQILMIARMNQKARARNDMCCP